MEKELNWNSNEFITFLLLHASHADLEFTDDEKEVIMERVSPDVFEEIYASYEEMGEFEVLQTILDYKGLYYPTNDRKNELLDLVKQQFHADGVVTSLEKSLMMFLEKLL
jgi:hypothetical protein